MKAISILGTTSNAGKSWVSTALCAWLRSQGVRVAPFKGQNMANNAYATIEGGEIGVAQAVQAEACGLRPIAEMNPILLKPSGDSVSQLVRLGRAGEHIAAKDYYRSIEASWNIVTETLDWWKSQCDVLVMEGAGSPVELNLMHRDIANLKPTNYVNGKWILVSSIEEGGVFAQVTGTYNLLPETDQTNGLGCIINRFRGDTSLFSDAKEHLEKHILLPYLGVLPLRTDLNIEDEDSLNAVASSPSPNTPYIAWIRYPHISNTQDQSPWKRDQGIDCHWIDNPRYLEGAAAIVLPGSKNTLSDLAWLKERKLDKTIAHYSSKGTPVVGICGGYQMLGRSLHDPATCEKREGIGLLPIETTFASGKTVTRGRAMYQGDGWETFEIHTGVTTVSSDCSPNPLTGYERHDGTIQTEGIESGNIWGSYQHGIFESAKMRQRLIDLAKIESVTVDSKNYRERRRETYLQMAEFLDANIDLEPIKQYLGI